MDVETSPLLRNRAEIERVVQKQGWLRRVQKHLSDWNTIYLAGLFILIVDIPAYMRAAPKLRMLELALCRDYYLVVDPSVVDPDGDVAEQLCKLEVIQGELATLRGT